MTANKILITGGATRIGAAIAKSLADFETSITIHYNNSKTNALKLKKELEGLEETQIARPLLPAPKSPVGRYSLSSDARLSKPGKSDGLDYAAELRREHSTGHLQRSHQHSTEHKQWPCQRDDHRHRAACKCERDAGNIADL